VVFVVDCPGMNRLHGRLDLVYDEWLYPVFETMGLAGPQYLSSGDPARSLWVKGSLTAFVLETYAGDRKRETYTLTIEEAGEQASTSKC
jgi:hypothetical protein